MVFTEGKNYKTQQPVALNELKNALGGRSNHIADCLLISFKLTKKNAEIFFRKVKALKVLSWINEYRECPNGRLIYSLYNSARLKILTCFLAHRIILPSLQKPAVVKMDNFEIH